MPQMSVEAALILSPIDPTAVLLIAANNGESCSTLLSCARPVHPVCTSMNLPFASHAALVLIEVNIFLQM
jgi:hypothetical protein